MTDIEIGASGPFKLWLRITRILDVQDKPAKLIVNQAAQIAALRDAVHPLQAREGMSLARAELAAVQAAHASTTDLAGRLGHGEECRDRS